MIDQSERLRWMAEYSYHKLRAEQERVFAARTRDGVAGSRHDALAELHEMVASDLITAWHPESLVAVDRHPAEELVCEGPWRRREDAPAPFPDPI